jgi:hypothetical protein
MRYAVSQLGYEGSYDRVAAFARQWKAGQLGRVNLASKRTVGWPQMLQSSLEDGNPALINTCGGNRSVSKPCRSVQPLRAIGKSLVGTHGVKAAHLRGELLG